MTALLAVEAGRAWSRRIWKGLLVFALAIIAIAGVLVFIYAAPDAGRPDDSGFQARDLVSDPNGETGLLGGLSIPFVLLAFILGASLIGAEWRAGTIGVVLTWEPRRPVVLLAKAGAAAVAGAALALVLQLGVLAAMLPSAARATNGVDAEFWRDLAGILFRTSAAAALMALVGFGIASLGRNTTAALAGFLVYFVVIEVVVGGFLPDWERWFVTNNFIVLLAGDAQTAGLDRGGTAGRSAVLLLGYVGALIAVATAWFQAHDIA